MNIRIRNKKRIHVPYLFEKNYILYKKIGVTINMLAKLANYMRRNYMLKIVNKKRQNIFLVYQYDKII